MPDTSAKRTWTRVAFGDVAKLSGERSANPADDGHERYVGLDHLEPGDLKIRRWGDIADGTTFTSVFRKGQVLFGKRRAYQRKVAVADFEGVCSGDIYVLEPKGSRLLPELLPFVCQTDGFFEYAVRTSAGSLSPRTNWASLASYEFSLPPLEEQRRIADVFRGLESVLASAQSAARRADELLQSMSVEYLPEVSSGTAPWPLGRLGDAVQIIDPNPSHRYPAYVSNGVPLVATQDFVGRDDFTFEKCQRVPRAIYEEQFDRCRFEPTDVVFARKGILGSARCYGVEEKAFSHTIVLLKPKGRVVDSTFLLWLVRSDTFMSQIRRSMNSNSGVPTLGVKTLEELRVWLPPMEAQERITASLVASDMALRRINDRIEEVNDLKSRALTVVMRGGEVLP